MLQQLEQLLRPLGSLKVSGTYTGIVVRNLTKSASLTKKGAESLGACTLWSGKAPTEPCPEQSNPLLRMIRSVHNDDDLAPASFSCPTPCLKTSLLDKDLSLGAGMGLQCKKSCRRRARGAVSVVAKSIPSWFSRLCQAALLLEMAINECNEPSTVDIINAENRTASLDRAINMLATSLVEDRDQGSHINCSLLAICIR